MIKNIEDNVREFISFLVRQKGFVTFLFQEWNKFFVKRSPEGLRLLGNGINSLTLKRNCKHCAFRDSASTVGHK